MWGQSDLVWQDKELAMAMHKETMLISSGRTDSTFSLAGDKTVQRDVSPRMVHDALITWVKR